MFRVITNRLLIAAPTVFIVCVFTFLLVQLVPGNPAEYMLGNVATVESIKALNAELGLNRPLLEQFSSWFLAVLHGDLGTSYISGQKVTYALTHALPATFTLAIAATVLTLLLGLLFGTIAAVIGGRLDGAIQSLSSLGMAIPNFWLAAMLIVGFSLKLHWLPPTGLTPWSDSPRGWVTSLILPISAIVFAGLAQVVLLARSSVLDALSKDFVRTLQAAGAPRRRILFKHVLRNAAIPVTTMAGLSFVFMLSGVIVIETIFNIPGMGMLMINAVNQHDLPVLQGAIVYFSIIVVVVNLGIDLIAAWLDPRLRTR